ncbi:MAG: alpha/beta hydrolase [Desulfobacteraceae bacterium]|nr:MAG: alpha/beta hydrolase [Desulfobacteraceae bacterium]
MTHIRQIRFDNHLGEQLAGTLEEPSNPNGRGMVLGHCFTCSRHTRILSDISERMATHGYTALRFDFSGNGQSDGVFQESTYSKQVRELQCAADYLRANAVSDILLAGHSMGGAAALLCAARTNKIAGVIALSVGAQLLYPERLLSEDQKDHLYETGETRFSSRGRELIITEDFFADAEGHDLLNAVSEIRCPILLVYGGKDITIAPDSGRLLYAANPMGAEIFQVDKADHMFSTDEDRSKVVDHVTKWLQKL